MPAAIGFEDAHLTFSDEDGYAHDTLEELTDENGCSPDELITATISIILDEDLTFSLDRRSRRRGR